MIAEFPSAARRQGEDREAYLKRELMRLRGLQISILDQMKALAEELAELTDEFVPVEDLYDSGDDTAFESSNAGAE